MTSWSRVSSPGELPPVRISSPPEAGARLSPGAREGTGRRSHRPPQFRRGPAPPELIPVDFPVTRSHFGADQSKDYVRLPEVLPPLGIPTPVVRMEGLGDDVTTGISTGVGLATSVVETGISAGIISASGTLAAAVPVVGAIAGGVLLAYASLKNLFSGCGASCTQATQIVNQAEPYLKQNRDAFLAHPTVTNQKAALSVFDQTWARVVQLCSNPALGAAGQRCISERQAGGSAPWCPTGTGCDWFILYRNPIANYSGPLVDDTPVGQVTGALGQQVGGIPVAVLLFGLVAAAVLMSD